VAIGRRAAAVLTATLCAASSQALSQQTPPTFRARSEVVSVTVSVKDGRRPITGLGPTDFEVFDNGIRQQIDSVAFDPLLIDVTLALTGYRVEASEDHLKGLFGASDFRALLRRDDRLRLVTINDSVSGRLVGPDFTVPTTHGAFNQIPGISVIDGLFYALAWPVEPDRRHLVVAFTDGWDTWSTVDADELPALASRSDAVLHVVFWSTPDQFDVGAPVGTVGISSATGVGRPRLTASARHEWEAGYRASRSAAERTGGTYRAASAGAEPFKSILEDFRTSYVLRYVPRGVDTSGWHELRVNITRPGSLTVRARKGYERR
jgi:hypothetical protein